MNRARSLVLILLLLAATSCHHAEPEPDGGTAKQEGPPPRVLVMDVTRKSVPIYGTFPAQTAASRTVQVRPRVEGYLLDFSFTEGSVVGIGQSLFEIDPAPFQAALETAQAARARALADVERAQAEAIKAAADAAYASQQVDYLRARADYTAALANLKKADEDVARYRPLAKIQAVPQQTLDYALATQAQAEAQVNSARASMTNAHLKARADIERARAGAGTAQANLAAARAQVRAAEADITRAQLDLSYTHVSSPIRGIIGKLAVSPGNLVGRGENTLLATIDQLDPMYADFAISEVDWLELSKPSRARREAKPKFDLILADGSTYGEKGDFFMVERGLNATTGTIMVRTTFPNPHLRLRPGQFARIRVITDVMSQAIVIPQRAVVEFQSLQTVYIVTPNNQVQRRTVVLGDRVDNDWIVSSGLKAGDRVIVEGVQKVRAGSTVTPEPIPQGATPGPASPPPASAAPSGGP